MIPSSERFMNPSQRGVIRYWSRRITREIFAKEALLGSSYNYYRKGWNTARSVEDRRRDYQSKQKSLVAIRRARLGLGRKTW